MALLKDENQEQVKLIFSTCSMQRGRFRRILFGPIGASSLENLVTDQRTKLQ